MQLQELKLRAEPPQMAALNYIETLAKDANVSIDMWDITKIFGSDLTLKATELNRKFSAYKEVMEIQKRADLPEETIQILLANQRKYRHTDVSSLESQNRADWDRIHANLVHNRTYSGRIQERNARILGFAKKIDLVTQVKQIVSQGYWEYFNPPTFSDYIACFVSPEVILKREPDAEGRTYEVNFGRLKFGIHRDGHLQALVADQQDLTTKICDYDHRGPLSDKFFFTCIKTDGNICWGTADELAARFEADTNFVDLMMVLQSLLRDTEGKNPYVPLISFFIYGKNHDGTAPWRDELPEEMKRAYGLLDPPPPEPIPVNMAPIPARRNEFTCMELLEDEEGREGECGHGFDSTDFDEDTDTYECGGCGRTLNGGDYQ